MAKSKGRLLAELLASDGKVKESKSALDISGGKLSPSDIPVLPNSKLENSSISIAGHSTSLGGSVTLDTGDIGEHTNYKYYTEGRARGAISASSGGGHGSVSYNASTGALSVTGVSTEAIQDVVGAMFSSNTESGITVTYDDTDGTIDLSVTALNTGNVTEGSNLYYTNARADARITNALKDEDNMASNSATHIPSQQSVKAYVDAQILTKDNTDEITEGSSNLYFTNARARAAISENSTQLAYNSTTGVLTFTQGNTDTVSEGSNLYYTTSRANSAIDARVTQSMVNALGINATHLNSYTGGSYALKASPALTGTPTAPTAAANTNTTQIATTAFVQTELTDLIDGAPGTLDTLNELAAAINDDSNYNSTLTTALATKLPLAGGTMTGNLIIAHASSPTLRIQDTTNTVKLLHYAQDANAISGTYSNHPYLFYTNSTLALTLSASQNATFAGTITTASNIQTTAGYLKLTSHNHIITTNNANNLKITTGGAGAAGILLENTGGNFMSQIYGDGTYYGFLDGAWANWDIKKTKNGQLQIDEGSGLVKVWTAGNDGSGSGLDADLLDGQHGSYYAPFAGSTSFRPVTAGLYGTGHGSSLLPIWQYNSSHPGYGFGYVEGTPDSFKFDVSNNLVSGTPDFEISENIARVNGNTVYHVGNDGSGTGLDADLLDGVQGSNYARLDQSNVFGAGTHSNYFRRNNTTNYTTAPLLVESYGGSSTTTGVGFHISGSVGRYLFMNNSGDLFWNSTSSEIWHASNDGSGSGLDADLLDGQQGSYYRPISQATTLTGAVTGSGTTSISTSNPYQNSVTFQGSNGNSPDSAMEYTQASSVSDSRLAPSTDWYNKIRMGHGDPYNYYGNTIAVKMTGTGYGDLYTMTVSNNSTGNWNKHWHANNDGSGSGLDADLLDGQHGSYYQPAGSYLTAETLSSTNTVTVTGTKYFQPAGSATSPLGGSGGASLQAYTTGTTAAYMAFHRSGAYAINWGLDTSNAMVLGGWSSSTTVPRMSIGTNGLMVTAGQGNLWGAGNDGSGSGLDADLLDGQHGSYYAPASSSTAGVAHGYLALGQLTSGMDTTNLDLDVVGNASIRAGSYLYFGVSSNNYGSWKTRIGSANTSTMYIHSQGININNTGYASPAVNWLTANASTFSHKGNTIWHAGNDGSGSGLDADLLDGQHGSYYLAYGNLTGTPTIPTIPSNNVVEGGTSYSGEYPMVARTSAYTIYSHDGIKFNGAQNKLTVAGSVVINGSTSWHAGNDGSGSGLDADLLDGRHLSQVARFQSSSDFANGTLVTTDINSANTNGDSFVIEVTGKAYGSSRPHSIIAEGYLYNNTIINTNGTNISGSNFTYLKVMNISGNLCFWWPRHGYWNSYDVHVRSSSGGTANYNRVTAIANSTDPSSATKKIQINLATSWTSANDGSGSGLDADLFDGVDSPVFFKSPSNVSGWQNNNANFSVRGGDSSNVGLHMEQSNGVFGFQLYSAGGTYGFLDAEWGGWDIQKVANGTFKVDEGSGLKRVLNEANWSSYITLPTNADTVDNLHAASFLRSDASDTFTGTITMGTQKALVANNYGRGVYGTYSSTAHQHVWSMGTSYNLADNGGSVGNLYGLSYTHTNVGTGYGNNSASGLGHQLNGRANGTLQWALGDGMWSSVTGSVWGASNDGSGSGLDADLLDGLNSSAFARLGGTNHLRSIPNRWFATADADNTIDYYTHAYAKAHMGNTYKYTTSRPAITSDSSYWIGSMGWGTIDLNTIFSYGSGFWDSWSTPSNAPSGTSHWTGLNALHYSANTGNAQYGMQQAMGAGNPSLFFVRGIWGGGFTTWRRIWNDGNDGSGSGLDADLLDGQQGSYYAPASSIPSVGNGTLTVTTSGSASGGGTFTANQSGNTTINISATDTNTTYNFSGSQFTSRNSGNAIAIDSVVDNMVGYVNSSTAAGYSDGAGFSAAYSSSWVGQLFVDFRTGKLSSRGKNSGTWQAHRFMWDNLNDGSGSGLDADLLDGQQGSYYYSSANYPPRTNFENVYNNLSTSTGASANLDSTFLNDRSGNFDCWSGTNFPPSTTHVQGIQVRHSTTTDYGWQLASQYNQPGKMYLRHISNGTFYGWNTLYTTVNDGSGSGLDADLLDGMNSGGSGSSIIMKTESNGYSQLNNWTQVGGAGLYSASANGAHFYPNTAVSYGTWRINGSRGGYTGTYYDYGGVVASMYDSAGNGGDWNGTNGWQHYWNRGNSCLAVAGSTTSSTYSLYVGGQIYATSNITAYSDRRVKENIIPIDNALEKVNALQGVYYNRIDDEDKTKEIGFIAQEVNEVVPELVTYAEDIDQYGVKYGNTTALLVEAVKELTQQVKDLKQEIEEIKNVK